ncbi:MAG: outer membrane protein assembly factor BamA [Gammaproteobacteria bacterium]
MSLRHLTGALFCICFLTAAWAPATQAAPQGSFTVEHIRVIGLKRITKNSVLTYMPGISVGENVGPEKIATAIRNLYGTGFFSDVQFRRAGSTLIIVVKERPTIAQVQLIGNKEIKTKALRKGLDQAGLTTGRFFDRASLEAITGSLTQTYFSHGRYAVEITPKIVHLKNNRVLIQLRIKEGSAADVLSINFTGNHDFSNGTLRDQFKLTTPGWFTWITHKDRYEEEKLNGSLENLRSFYENRGYADFHINSVQVQLSPARSGIYINVNLHEGGKYKIGKVKLLGTFPIKEKILEKRIFIQPGKTFSLQLANAQAQYLTNVLGAYGYGFAKVSPLPKTNPKTHKVDLVFYIEPGPRVYVRHINFHGAPGTNDMVFRRQMRQAEGTWLNNLTIKRSRTLLQRLPFVKTADIKPQKIPGSPDKVDLDVNLDTRQSGTANVTLGYGGYYGLDLGGQIALSNFLGEGKIIRLDADKNQVYTNASLSYTDPYLTVNGVSRTVKLFYQQGTRLNINTSQFLQRNYGAALSYGFPLSEFNRYNLGVTYRHGTLSPYCGSSNEFKSFVSNPDNGSVTVVPSYCAGLGSVPVNTPLSTLTYNNLIFTAGFVHDTRDRTVLPTRGTRQAFQLQLATPLGQQTYYTLSWDQFTFVPLGLGLIYGLNSEVGIGNSYGKTTTLPPYAHFFAGGPDSVAGFQSGTLGPRDSNGYPYGGEFVTWARNELILPNFLGHKYSYRLALFVDTGNVFAAPADFKLNRLRVSYGIGLSFLTPLGALGFSYAVPLRDEPGDYLERFQFTLGAYF